LAFAKELWIVIYHCSYWLAVVSADIVDLACRQRGGGFTQAGVLQRLGREQMMLLPALCQTSPHPRLRETARCLLAFFILL